MEIGIKTGRGKIARPEFFLGFGGGAAQGENSGLLQFSPF